MDPLQTPTIGRVVVYRSRTGSYACPAIVTATIDTLDPVGVQLGHVPDLDSPDHVHLTVFTPGVAGKRRDAADLADVAHEDDFPRSENVSGCYQEWNVLRSDAVDATPGEGSDQAPGTWAWPARG